jgi:hypothetical protein
VVIDAMSRYIRAHGYATVNRSAYALAEATERHGERPRRGGPLHQRADRPRDRVHQERHRGAQPGGLRSWGTANLAEGDVVVLTHMEHHANIVPWHQLVAERGIELRWISAHPDGQLDLTDLPVLLDGAKMLSFTAMSNVLGTITPVPQMAARPTLPARWSASTVPVRAPPPHRRHRTGTPTSSPSPATRCAARPASACCGAARSCSTPCPRSSAEAA